MGEDVDKPARADCANDEDEYIEMCRAILEEKPTYSLLRHLQQKRTQGGGRARRLLQRRQLARRWQLARGWQQCGRIGISPPRCRRHQRRASTGAPAGPRAGQDPGITGNKRRLT
jgi:hypothetical protein